MSAFNDTTIKRHLSFTFNDGHNYASLSILATFFYVAVMCVQVWFIQLTGSTIISIVISDNDVGYNGRKTYGIKTRTSGRLGLLTD